jgi:hypothetical protein
MGGGRVGARQFPERGGFDNNRDAIGTQLAAGEATAYH